MTLSVTAVGAKPPCYKWRRNGQDITHPKCSGIDTSTLTISCFSSEHEGNYTCIVSDGKEVLESAPAKLKLGKQKLVEGISLIEMSNCNFHLLIAIIIISVVNITLSI